MISFRSVKFRLSLWTSVLLTFFLIAFSIFMYWAFHEALFRDADRAIMNEAEAIEEALRSRIAPVFSGKQFGQNARFFSGSPYFDIKIQAQLIHNIETWEKEHKKIARSRMMIRLVGLDHKPLIQNLKPWEKEVIYPDFERDAVFMETGESLQTIHFRTMPVRLHYRLVRQGLVPVYIIQTGLSLAEMQNTLNRFKLIIVVTISLAVLASFVAGWYVVKRSFNPLDRMIREARKITGENLKLRLPRTLTGDELDRLAETLNEMIDRVDTSKRVVQEFSSNITHELKTPLAIIRGEIDVATRRSRSAEDLVQSLRVIEGETHEMIRMVDDLIFLVRTDAQQLRYEMNEVSITEILRHSTSLFQERARLKSISLEAELEDHLVAMADAVYIKRVFANLLDNALKFTPEQGFIKVYACSQGARIRVQIQDSGMGIEPDKASKVFLRFYRTDSARKFEGSGLGLNIVKAICDAHRIEISVDSVLGKGSTFNLIIPAMALNSSPAH